MKDWNFIERLSAYMDGELPREQVAALEEELRSDPRKMRTYREYLRLDRGAEALCKGIASQSARPHFNLENNVIWVPKTVTPRKSWVPSWGAQFAALGAAAAAAVGVVLFSLPEGGAEVPAEIAAVRNVQQLAPENVYVISESGLGRFGARSQMQREVYRLDELGRLVRMEVATDLPGAPAHLTRSASDGGAVRSGDAYLGGRGGAFSANAAFATYQFQR